jgi:hypothetical protein
MTEEIDELENAVTDEQPKKRGRGRPRKEESEAMLKANAPDSAYIGQSIWFVWGQPHKPEFIAAILLKHLFDHTWRVKVMPDHGHDWVATADYCGANLVPGGWLFPKEGQEG